MIYCFTSYTINERRRSSNDRRSEFFIGMMRRMDANRNGSLEPHEISSRARPYVDRVARSAGLNTSGSLSIRAMEEAIRKSSGTRDSGRSRQIPRYFLLCF